MEWQIRVASGEELPLTQEEIKLNGHAFEARIYAENPREGFLPGAGNLKYLRPPEGSKHVRIETGEYIKKLNKMGGRNTRHIHFHFNFTSSIFL